LRNLQRWLPCKPKLPYCGHFSRLPNIKWAQRKDRVFLTVEQRDIENEKIEWVSPTHLKIEVTSDKKVYAVDLELFDEINVDVFL